jgi:hypothetical protein
MADTQQCSDNTGPSFAYCNIATPLFETDEKICCRNNLWSASHSEIVVKFTFRLS